MKVIVAGSRTFNDRALMWEVLSSLPVAQLTEVVSGGARGADSLGEQWARSRGVKVTRFEADWDRYSKRAGYLRNQQMAEYADGLVAFWDGKSKGTEHMINLAKRAGLWVLVYGDAKCW
jgi:hypothetical protein